MPFLISETVPVPARSDPAKVVEALLLPIVRVAFPATLLLTNPVFVPLNEPWVMENPAKLSRALLEPVPTTKTLVVFPKALALPAAIVPALIIVPPV